MRGHLIAAAGVFALSTSLAMAQGTTLTEAHLGEVDSDKSGSVTLEELSAFMKRGFEALDKDVDGFVTWTEAEVAMLREDFDAIDADKDGRMTPTELDTQVRADFAASDRDGDGTLN